MNNNSPKRLTVVAPYFYPKIGGLENYAYLLAKNLHDLHGYQVSVITSHYDGEGYKKEMIDGMTVHRLPISFKISNTPINLGWSSLIKKIIKEEDPAIVHIHAPVPYMPDIASHVAGARAVVLTYHSGSMLKGSYPADFLIGAYEKIFLPLLFKRADAVVAVSQEFAKRTFPQYTNKIFFIPTGVDLERFKVAPLPPDTERVTFVGRIEHSSSWKGIEPLLQAMAIVKQHRPNATLELVGGGDAIDHYKQRAKELDIADSVIFAGPQLGQDLVAAYNRANVVVLPSMSDSEAFSIALVEAMATGRPLIATRVGGNPQVVEEGKNGLLVPPKDPQALAAAIEKVLGDRGLAQQLADNGAIKARGFSWVTQTKKYSDLFDTVLP
jgi:glycosyltransferase involved in cell wall biosynthesis